MNDPFPTTVNITGTLTNLGGQVNVVGPTAFLNVGGIGDSGVLTLPEGSTVNLANGSYQLASGTLGEAIGENGFAIISVNGGLVLLDGTLDVLLDPGFNPAVGSNLTPARCAARSRPFRTTFLTMAWRSGLCFTTTPEGTANWWLPRPRPSQARSSCWGRSCSVWFMVRAAAGSGRTPQPAHKMQILRLGRALFSASSLRMTGTNVRTRR